MRFNSLPRRRSGPSTPRVRYQRPTVEVLESRLVPSTTINHGNGFASHTDLTANGYASFGSAAMLTQGGGLEAGSIFTNSPVDITQFNTTFTFAQTPGTNPWGGGLTFTIQNVGPTALGSNQEGLGYAGIGNSVAIKFDVFNNLGEGNSSTGLFTNGHNPTVPSQSPDTNIDLDGTSINLRTGDTFQVTLNYSGSTLSETIRDLNTGGSYSTSYNVNIPQIIGSSSAFVGFTGSTGGLTNVQYNVQNIQSWTGTFGAQTSGLTITSLSPSSAQAGSAGFTLTVNGTGFGSGAMVQWQSANGTTTQLQTTPISSTQLQAIVTSGLLTTPGTATVTVTQVVGHTGATSNPAAFTITSSPFTNPVITSVSPSSVLVGSGNTTLTLTGSNFASNAQVTFSVNGLTITQPATAVSSNGTLLTVTIPAGFFASTGTASVTVTQGTLSSNTAFLNITSSPFTNPVITSVSPNPVAVGSGNTLLTLTGSNFTSNALVTFSVNGLTITQPATAVSSNGTLLTVTIPSGFFASPGTASVTVTQGTLSSNTAFLTIGSTSGLFISSLSTNSVQEGSSSFTLTVNGSGFTSGSTVQWTQNGTTTPLQTIVISSNQLLAVVQSSMVAEESTPEHGGPISISVSNGFGSSSNAVGFTVTEAPLSLVSAGSTINAFALQAITPTLATFIDTGGPETTPSISANYSASINWGDASITNGTITENSDGSFSVSGTHAYTAGGTYSIVVTITHETAPPITATVTANINQGPFNFPSISSITPSTVPAGSSSFPLTVTGSNFNSTATVYFALNNGTPIPLTTTFVSPGVLTATVPSYLLTTSGTATVSVSQLVNGSPQSSNGATFTIGTAPLIAPIITSLRPFSAQAGSGSFILTINGSNFVMGATVQFMVNGSTTTLQPFSISSNVIQVVVPNYLLTTVGNANVTVSEVLNNNFVISNVAIFNITPVTQITPVISSLSPSSVQVGSSSTFVTITGSNFVAGATVQFSVNGSTFTLRPTSISNDGTTLVVVVPTSLLTTQGTASLTVSEVLNGNFVTSNPALFTIGPISPELAPIITSIRPFSIPAGSPSFLLTVNGSNFAPGATVQFNGTTLPVSSVNSTGTVLQAVIPANLLTTAGNVNVTVTQQLANGSFATSNVAIFNITSGPVSPTIVATGLDISATANVAQDFTVAQFTDSGPGAQPGAYAVSINFGDGTPVQAGTVTQPGGPGTPFLVTATHTYTQTGSFTITTRIFKESGGFAQASSTATVGAAGGAASVGPLGQNPLRGVIGAGTVELGSPLTPNSGKAATQVPIQSPTTAASGQPTSAEDLYWQLVGRGESNDWAPDALTANLGGITN